MTTNRGQVSDPLRLYADDSGNTGSDLLTREQPLGVTAMVLLSAEQERELLMALRDARTNVQNRVPEELKFAKLARTSTGRHVLRAAMNALIAGRVRVFLSIAEKRFLAAALVVETFLDPLTTQGAPLAMLDGVERRKASNIIYQSCDNSVLADFLSAAAKWNRDDVCRAGDRIAKRLALHPSDEGPALSNAIQRGLRDPFDWSSLGRVVRLADRPTPHTFTTCIVLAVVDQYLSEAELTATLIADEDAVFGPMLEHSFRVATAPNTFPGGMSPYGVSGPITRIVRREEKKSNEEIGIQLADLVAGLVSSVAQCDVDKTDLGDLSDAWTSLEKVLVESAPSTFWQLSELMLDRLPRSFGELVPPRDEWWWLRP